MKRYICMFIIAAIYIMIIPGRAKAPDISKGLGKYSQMGLNKNNVNFIEVTISAVGDCTLGEDKSLNEHVDFTEEFVNQNRDYGFFFKNVEGLLEGDDVTIANLETTLTKADKMAKKKFRFKGDPSYTRILQRGGVEVVNIANNHIYDYLTQGFKDTTANLKKANIGICGYGYKHVYEVKGIKIGFLGYTGWDNTTKFKNSVKADIQQMKKSCNAVVVSFHWGSEYTNSPDSTQKSLGRYAIDCGADLVLGHHPHVIQGIEYYKGRNIVYSLGNFVFGGNVTPRDYDSFIFQQTLKFDGNKKIIDTSKTNIIPCTISSIKGRNNYQPVILSGEEGKRVIERITKYSKAIK